MIRRSLALVLGSVLLMASSCANVNYKSDATGLLGTWDVVSIAGQAVVESAKPTMTFALSDQFGGNTGVNRYNGTFSLGSGTLSFGPLVTTRMAGPQDAMDQEGRFLAALGSVRKFDLGTDTLTLQAENGDVAVKAVRAKVEEGDM